MFKRVVTIPLCVAAIVLASVALARPEENAFLNKPANTHAQLMGQIKTDNVVMDRYMRHFGMTRQEVIAYFSGLNRSRLDEDGVYLVYNVPDWGELRARALFYKKGTPVWKDADGRPILKASCGNPMVRGTDGAPPELDVEVPEMDSEVFAFDAPVTSETTPVLMSNVSPVLPEVATLPMAASAPGVPGVPGIGWVLPLAAGFLVSGGGGGSPIPEPATIIIMGAGVAALAARRRNKKS